jgi:capsular polysaccharide transport system ATP-binding protein
VTGLELIDVSKTYPVRNGHREVLHKINLTLPPERKLGILGRNGSGKSALIRIIGGAERPTSGIVRSDMRVSWPLAFGGGFQGGLTGFDNARFIARIYRADPRLVVDYVERFAELGAYLYEPVVRYSSGMRARLAFALSLAINFDCLLIDEIVAVGDRRFEEKCRVELFEKRRNKAWIVVSHNPAYIREHCDSAAVLDCGRMQVYADVDAAYRHYDALVAA